MVRISTSIEIDGRLDPEHDNHNDRDTWLCISNPASFRQNISCLTAGRNINFCKPSLEGYVLLRLIIFPHESSRKEENHFSAENRDAHSTLFDTQTWGINKQQSN